MSKPLRNRTSSTTFKKNPKSIEKESLSSIKRSKTASILNESSQEVFTSVSLEPEKPKINYQDELVLIFFNSMLDNIIDEWITIPSEPPVCLCNNVNKEETENITTKDFKELLPEDFQNMVIDNVQGSTLSLIKNGRSSVNTNSSIKGKKHSTNKGKKHKSNEKFTPEISLQQSSKGSIDIKKLLTSNGTITSPTPSNFSIDWCLNPPDEDVVIKFKNGNYYEGPVSKKLMHGIGKFIWADGAVYDGEFNYGNATGKGTLQYSDLTFYTGNFCKSFLHGEGVLNISSTSMIYSGNWKGGEKHGEGWLLYEPGNWYQGEWYENKRQGVGLRQYSTSVKYKGKWYQGERHGKGTIVWANNDFYTGEWVNGKMHGYGEYTWNGFLNETFTFPVENTYQGNWINGMRNGVGIMNFGTEGGAKLAGIWENNKKHGAGVMLCGNGTTVERNPLFWIDNPIHLETEANSGYAVTTVCDCDKSCTEIQGTVSVENHIENNKSTLQLIAQQVHTKHGSKHFGSQILESIAVNGKKIKSSGSFPKPPPVVGEWPITGKVECSPIHIPIHLPPEQIDFSYYTNLAVQKYTAWLYKIECTMKEAENMNICGGIRATEGFPSTVSKFSKWNILGHNSDLKSSKVSQNSSKDTTRNSTELESKLLAYQQVQTQIEEKHLRNTILAHLPQLRKVYDKYATIACPYVLSFKPIIIRYFLWQMLRDLNIVSKTYTLFDMDRILIEYPGSGLESEHYPFEKIYFWQFLQILLTLAWLLHSPSDVTEECKRFGILSAIFTKFLTETVYENVVITFAGSLFAYRDLLPINSVYLWYQKLGEPHTARKFLYRTCTKKHEQPPCYLKIFPDEKTPKPRTGINAVPVGENIVFLPEDPPDFGEKSKEPYPDLFMDDPFRKDLFALRSLGPKKVVACLINVCPQISNEGVIVNMDYPLLFIEFYETLLMCAFLIVDRIKKREEQIRLREERNGANSSLTSKTTTDTKTGKNNKDKKKSKTK